MKHKSSNHIFIALGFCILLLSSCQQPGGNSTGSEFMPDMAHSVAYEANSYNYYYNNTWGTEDEYYHYATPREPVAGTIPRGSAGLVNASSGDLEKIQKSLQGELTNMGISIPVNGNVPYAYADTEADRLKATNEVIQAGIPITESGLKEGKELYEIFCGICHGNAADGLGFLVREDGGKYEAAPANLLLENYVNATNGQYYHAIVYGKNLMGGYGDKLSFEERWNVIHYIRSLQAKSLKLAYNQEENTLNSWATPMADIVVHKSDDHTDSHDMMDSDHKEGDHKMEDHDDHGSDSHGEEHGHDNGH